MFGCLIHNGWWGLTSQQSTKQLLVCGWLVLPVSRLHGAKCDEEVTEMAIDFLSRQGNMAASATIWNVEDPIEVVSPLTTTLD